MGTYILCHIESTKGKHDGKPNCQLCRGASIVMKNNGEYLGEVKCFHSRVTMLIFQKNSLYSKCFSGQQNNKRLLNFNILPCMAGLQNLQNC